MSSEQAADYDLLKEAILNRYGIREETYRQRFRSTKKTGNETYRELGSKLKDTAKKWLRECETSGFVRESQGRATKRSSWLTTSCRLGSVEASKAQRIAAEEKKPWKRAFRWETTMLQVWRRGALHVQHVVGETGKTKIGRRRALSAAVARF